MRNKIILGEIYGYDKSNKIGQYTDEINFVIPVKKERGGMYKVKEASSMDDEHTFSVHKSMLSPINQPIIRTPINCPIITKEDISIFRELLNITSMNSLINEDKQKRLQALCVKLQYANEITEDKYE